VKIQPLLGSSSRVRFGPPWPWKIGHRASFDALLKVLADNADRIRFCATAR
jgi:hypothetical protein